MNYNTLMLLFIIIIAIFVLIISFGKWYYEYRCLELGVDRYPEDFTLDIKIINSDYHTNKFIDVCNKNKWFYEKVATDRGYIFYSVSDSLSELQAKERSR